MQLNECPICQNNLNVKKLSCSHCQVDFEGEFYTSPLMALSQDHQQFIELFVLSSGSLKEMAQIMGVTYPTVRSRLDRVIDRLKDELKERDDFKNQILEKVAQGSITAEKAADIIKNL
ncbi:MAG: DUF2089 domain-containing protein [Candidatus Omnitrophica bacterium]|nr:DUF2089 domain-containing protein [Candidatus Omnitrophota bacterium]